MSISWNGLYFVEERTLSFDDWETFPFTLNTDECGDYPYFGRTLVSWLKTAIENPTGDWKDYNCLYKAWRQYSLMVPKFICEDDLPPMPLVSDYSDNLDNPAPGLGWTTFSYLDYSLFTFEQWNLMEIDPFICGQGSINPTPIW